ncbi:HIT family protein [Kitasatospora kifunensis]|uniref:Diadenosine tetraphosphate (Ap4A) HIT family hydrolase n=1 Tax=Kitasatospora kifunensis TaxID=58351 RepID=A0A7W7R574_KITKI|nr:HIT family protein [Kitasatospora kifunensis]MBB4925490.1 diadenosine tetraphosphate (Ap4A) HIT family hydrolase [Kitasatospora kifunensis]
MPADSTTAACYSCSQTALLPDLPPRESVAVDENWRVAHAFGTGLLGWLVLVPRRHVTTIAELTAQEAAALGGWQVRLSQALTEVTGCSKTYLAQFSEAPGFSHLHFHLVPRPAELDPQLRGPGVFALLGNPAHPEPDTEAMDEVARRLRVSLLGHP